MNVWMDFLIKRVQKYNYFDTIFTIYKMALLIAFIDWKFPLLLPDTCYISFYQAYATTLTNPHKDSGL